MTIQCPYTDCTQQIEIESSIAGDQASCPTCGRPFVCPSLHEFPLQERTQTDETRTHAAIRPPEARRQTQSSRIAVMRGSGTPSKAQSSSRANHKPKGSMMDFILLPFQFILNWVGCIVGASLIGGLFMEGGWEAGLFTGIVFGFPVAIFSTVKSYKKKRNAK